MALNADLTTAEAIPGPTVLEKKRRVFCILNCRAGAAAASQREVILRAFDASRAEDELLESVVEVCESPGFLSQIVRRAVDSRFDIIVAAGGDGTISTVADQLIGTGIPLGVLPVGTLNHFAKDLGIPLDLSQAVEVICRGAIKKVDVGEVNGRYFLNNSSLGVYPQVVAVRERWRPVLGKWPAVVIGTMAVLRRFPLLKLRIEIDGKVIRRRAPLLFIGNNEYSVEWPALGGRPRLDQGCLSLWLMQGVSRWSLIRLTIDLLLGKLHLAPELEVHRLQKLTIRSHARRIRVAVDGEVLRLRPPLQYRLHPQMLDVCVPAV
jgi:YegS/Rv2252/BmrU family lipid kinase